MNKEKQKAIEWLRIVAVLAKNGYLSPILVLTFVDTLNRNFGYGSMQLYEEESKNIDYDSSEALVSVVLK